MEKNKKDYYNLELTEIYEKFDTDPKKGLAYQEAEQRLNEYGPNEIPKVSKGFIKIYLAPLFNWLIVIYLVCALIMFIAAMLGQEGNMSMIALTLGIVALNCIVAIIQQYRATKKLNALRELTAPTTTVIREGKKKDTPTQDLVVGDLLVLNQGDKIPADGRIITSANLEVNEASLTGESEPVKKTQDGKPLEEEDISIGERVNMVFYGTHITTGTGLAIVVKTGGDTEIGKISRGLEEAGTSEIPVRKKMNNFGKWLGVVIVGLWLIILIFKWATAGNINIVGSLNAALDLMPINLPLLVTIILLTGVLAMARFGVIIRNLASVDSLGRTSVVCTDKTGTLTKNEMCVQNVWSGGYRFKVSGTGYNLDGKIYLVEDEKNVKSVHNKIGEYPVLKELLISGYLNNNSALVKNQVEVGSKVIDNWKVVGSPTEGALMVLFQKGMEDYILDDYELVKEFPFDSRIKRMSKVYKKGGEVYSFTKGASEVIIPLCSKIRLKDQVVEFTGDRKEEVMQKVNEFAGKGYRILSICSKELPSKPPEKDGRVFCESDMTYLGFVTILDPPREGVQESVHQCYDAGVDVVMITGDSPATARAIAQQISIIKSQDERVCEGNQIDEEIKKDDFDQIKVFARVSPEHKQVIIEKYQNKNRVVAMTGDGVNDTLALNMADAGIAMGIQGTDVAKEASDMVISDDSFNSIVKGIHQGRGIFAKIRAVVFFYICINVFEGLVAFILAVILDNPWWIDPSSPFYMQWIFLSITLHTFPGLILTFDIISDDIMKEKPKDSEEILSRNTLQLMMFYGALLGVSMILVYFLTLSGAYPVFSGNIELGGWNEAYLYTTATESLSQGVNLNAAKALTMLMTTLFFCESFLVYQIRRPNKDLITQFKEDSSKFMYLLIGFLFFSLLSLMYIPAFQVGLASMGINFMFMYLTALDWLVCFAISLITIVGFEVVKYYGRENNLIF
ncbi:MAG: cation-translocating P-type ATPase [Promethearchaeia archaeon]